jgi:hypothetical protein
MKNARNYFSHKNKIDDRKVVNLELMKKAVRYMAIFLLISGATNLKEANASNAISVNNNSEISQENITFNNLIKEYYTTASDTAVGQVDILFDKMPDKIKEKLLKMEEEKEGSLKVKITYYNNNNKELSSVVRDIVQDGEVARNIKYVSRGDYWDYEILDRGSSSYFLSGVEDKYGLEIDQQKKPSQEISNSVTGHKFLFTSEEWQEKIDYILQNIDELNAKLQELYGGEFEKEMISYRILNNNRESAEIEISKGINGEVSNLKIVWIHPMGYSVRLDGKTILPITSSLKDVSRAINQKIRTGKSGQEIMAEIHTIDYGKIEGEVVSSMQAEGFNLVSSDKEGHSLIIEKDGFEFGVLIKFSGSNVVDAIISLQIEALNSSDLRWDLTQSYSSLNDENISGEVYESPRLKKSIENILRRVEYDMGWG